MNFIVLVMMEVYSYADIAIFATSAIFFLKLLACVNVNIID